MAARTSHAGVTHVFEEGDEYLGSDAVFGVKDSLIHRFEQCEPGTAPDGQPMNRPYYHLQYDFTLAEAAQSRAA